MIEAMPALPTDRPIRAAIWARVSTDEQETGNQLDALHRWARNRGMEITPHQWVLEESAWNGKHRKALDEALAAARLKEFDVLLIWALDRISREGVEETLATLRRFRERGVMVWSLQEPWTETADASQAELLTSILAWMAAQESKRRSERVRAAIERRKAEGTWTGRGKDQGKRKATGYAQAAREREAKKRQQAKARKVLDAGKEAV